MIVGEITTKAGVDYPEIARETTCGIGYDDPDLGFEGRSGAFRETAREGGAMNGFGDKQAASIGVPKNRLFGPDACRR